VAAVSRPLNATTSEIDVFARGTDSHLYDDYWDGYHWQWLDLGAPPNRTVGTDPSAAFYQINGVTKVYAFVGGSDGHLFVNYGAGTQRRWADLGPPPNTTVRNRPAAIAAPFNGFERLYAFVSTSNGQASGHLAVDFWDGTRWTWADLGTPSGGSVTGEPGAGTYSGKLYVYVQVLSGHLAVDYWTGARWQWADQGVAPGGGVYYYAPQVVSAPLNGFTRLYAFVVADTVHLAVNFWDGTRWTWADQGPPPGGGSALSDPGVATYNGNLYAFVRASSGHLALDYWTGTQWRWADQGTPPNATLNGGPGVVVASFQGTQRLYAFVTDSAGHVGVNYWDGSRWWWADQGTPQ
jgi:hypothetical protein